MSKARTGQKSSFSALSVILTPPLITRRRSYSSYSLNRWYGDHQEVDLLDPMNTLAKATLARPASSKLLTTFLLSVKTGVRSGTAPMLTPSIYIFFAGPWGSSPVIHLNDLTDRADLFQSLELDEFTFTIPDTGTVIDTVRSSIEVSLAYASLADDHARLEHRRSCSVDVRLHRREKHDHI